MFIQEDNLRKKVQKFVEDSQLARHSICIRLQSMRNRAAMHRLYTGKVIPDRKHLHVLFVTDSLHCQVILLSTAEFTAETNRTSVTCVTRHLVSMEI